MSVLKQESSVIVPNTNLKLKKIVRYLSITIVVLFVTILFGFWTFVHKEKLTNAEVLEKYQSENGQYFVNIEEINLPVSSNVWKLIEVGEHYNVDYKWSHLRSAKVEQIEKAN
ncbi:hypothetical protein [Aquibacillus kalidii]|uniref:hypothetical protein n=1 Tax=Aquibacillus kalidii TaxID=2762597 RepID=UPI001648B124|nr:hypothetical protein [Aquibacillus kalidii]